jgi:hypothetical protein
MVVLSEAAYQSRSGLISAQAPRFAQQAAHGASMEQAKVSMHRRGSCDGEVQVARRPPQG